MILIKDAELIDGSGQSAIKRDVLIKGDRISAIGTFPKKNAELVINGSGAHLLPGFIDVNTDSDHYLTLFTHPAQEAFLRQGVTSIIGGHCGSSLTPLLYGSLESIRKWADINQVNVNWNSVKEFLEIVARAKIGVNFGTLIGHSTIRRALIGDVFRDLTVKEMEVFKAIVTQALEEGAFGLSTGLGYAHARQVSYHEIKSLAELVRSYDGVYTTHLRNEREGVLASVGETILLAKETKVKTLISHFRPLLGFEQEYQESLSLLEATAHETNIHFDNYPSDMSVVAIYTLLPAWVQNGGLEIMIANIKSGYLQERILGELPEIKPDDVSVVQAPGNDYLVGKTLGEYARNHELDLRHALLQLMIDSQLRAVVLYKNINLDWTIKSLTRPQALVASNSPGLSEGPMVIKQERAINTFPKFLNLMTATKLLPFEKAVQKITSIPARVFNLRYRGEVKEGNFADLVLWKDGKVSDVIVNGEVAVKDGALKPVRAGRVLKRSNEK